MPKYAVLVMEAAVWDRLEHHLMARHIDLQFVNSADARTLDRHLREDVSCWFIDDPRSLGELYAAGGFVALAKTRAP